MKNNTIQFWNWFKQHHNAYLTLDLLGEIEKGKLLDELMGELHKYSEALYFEIGGYPGETQELIITAEGDEDYFNAVERLIADAPTIENWKFMAFIPPSNADFNIDFEGVILKSSEMWFLPLNNPNEPNSIGIRVCMKDYELIKNQEYFMSTVYKAIDTVVGEKIFAKDIAYIEAGRILENPTTHKMIELPNFQDTLPGKRSKSKTDHAYHFIEYVSILPLPRPKNSIV